MTAWEQNQKQEEEGMLYHPVKKVPGSGDNTKKLLFYAFVVALAAIAFYLGAHSVTCSCAQPDVNVTGWIINGTLVQ